MIGFKAEALEDCFKVALKVEEMCADEEKKRWTWGQDGPPSYRTSRPDSEGAIGRAADVSPVLSIDVNR